MSKELTAQNLKNKYHLTAKEFSDLRELFKAFDKDKNNRISLPELKELLVQLDKFPDADGLITFFNKIDTNKDGKVDFEDFIRLLVDEQCSVNEDPFLLDTFRFFDSNGNGSIAKSEFVKAMYILGENRTLNQIGDLFTLAGKI